MSLGPGWAEFNDANAIIRGRVVAAKGTFSGEFATDNIDAVGEVNIRGNAISTYYGFSFGSGAKVGGFTIPAQQFTSIADITVPITIESKGTGAVGKATLRKNGSIIETLDIILNTSYTPSRDVGMIMVPASYGYFSMMYVLRFIDFNVSSSSNSTYEVSLEDGLAIRYWTESKPIPVVKSEETGRNTLRIHGSAVVGCRKR